MSHLDDSEGLALTPMCRACQFHSSMTFKRDEALLHRSTFVRQAYVNSLREGILVLARQQAEDRARIDRSLAEAVVVNLFIEQSADWFPGPPIS